MSTSTKECATKRAVHTQTDHHCPHIPYVELSVPSEASKVLEVVFTIVSHDQGWADNGDVSYTWFEAVIRRGQGLFDQREIVRNRRANAEFFRHTISWHDSTTSEAVNWVRGLQAGDVIQVIPKAAYQAWVNSTQECHIKLKYQTQPADRVQDHVTSNDLHYSKPLDSIQQQIRLLNIRPGTMNDPIRGYFSYTHLSDDDKSVSFDALSYCWGNPHHQTTMHLAKTEDGIYSPFAITKSVDGAIRHLRHDQKPLRIWIDALCINQSDIEERSQQVRLMDRVYSSAENVHIWLGEGSASETMCLRIIRDIYNFNFPQCPGGDECRCQGTGHSLKPEQVQQQVESAKHIFGTLRGMHEVFELTEKHFSREIIELAGGFGATNVSRLMMALYKNPWFTRVWVVQEAILARKAMVHCSGEAVPWEEVLAMSESLRSPKYMDYHIHNRPGMAHIWHSIKSPKDTLQASGSDTSSKERTQLDDVLDVFLRGLGLQATDPRDKLFALFAFGKETHSAEELDALIQPDYSKPVERVYADFTRWWIKTHKSLSILSAVHWQPDRQWRRITGQMHKRHLADQPSWALSAIGSSEWAHATLTAQFKFGTTDSMGPELKLLETEQPLVLQLSGRAIATISSIGYFPVRLLVQQEERNADPNHIANVFERILDPSGLFGHWGTPVVRDESERTISRMLHEYGGHLHSHMGNEEDPELRERQNHRIPSCLDRCYFTASDGKIGLCPYSAKEGDTIVLLRGANVPYLLRPVKEGVEFELIGECFVNGIMLGETETGTEEQVFRLV